MHLFNTFKCKVCVYIECNLMYNYLWRLEFMADYNEKSIKILEDLSENITSEDNLKKAVKIMTSREIKDTIFDFLKSADKNEKIEHTLNFQCSFTTTESKAPNSSIPSDKK